MIANKLWCAEKEVVLGGGNEKKEFEGRTETDYWKNDTKQ